jgi:hypothetical protein
MKKGGWTVFILLVLISFDLFTIQTAASAGRKDPFFEVDHYNPAKACNGTTILPDNHNLGRPRIVELDMKGRIVWGLKLKNVTFRSRMEAPARGFYKAQWIAQ